MILLIIVIGLILWGIASGHLDLPFDPEPPVLDRAVTELVIDKSDREMIAYADGVPLKTYTIALGFAPDGDKVRQGDGKTPEGTFTVNRRNPQSSFHLSLGLDYPLPEDIARARRDGIDPGGDIFIHGQPNRVPDNMMVPGDWTAGCIAVTNPEIQELWDHVAIGTTVTIKP